MDVTGMVIISILLQLIAAALALRLIWVTKWSPAWVLIAAAISTMTLRRGISLYQFVFRNHPLDPSAELVGLAISVLMVVGIAWIAPLFNSIIKSEAGLRLNESRLEALWKLSQMSEASLQQITDFALEAAVSLTKSKIGYLAFMNEDETVLTMHSWSKTAMEECAVTDKPIVYPLETTGLWGEAVRQRRPIVTNDYAAPNPYKKGYPEGHVPVRRHMNIPVLDGGKIVAVAGVGNKQEAYDEADVRQLTLLMNGMWWLIQRQRAEEALSLQIERLHQFQTKLIQTSSDGIIANDRYGNIIIFNEGAERILGYSKEEVVGKLKVEQLYPPGLAREIKKKIYSSEYGGPGQLLLYETVAVTKTGELVPIELSASPILEDGGEMAVVGFFRDLRERKKLEEKVLQAERLAILGTMVAHINHEIKNPLMLMGGFARQLERLSELPQEARRKLQLIREETQRLEKFLADMSIFTHIPPPQKIPGDLPALVREVAELMEAGFKENRVEFELQAPPDLPAFPFDPGQIRQVLINLFKNAVEAMPQGGRLAVAMEAQEGNLILRVTDAGQGIPPEHLKALFTPFFSTKEKGTGLGLTISRQLVEQHQGEIWLESEVARGTTCFIRLPLNPS
jgi:PAS domain S-box-containing protein